MIAVIISYPRPYTHPFGYGGETASDQLGSVGKTMRTQASLTKPKLLKR